MITHFSNRSALLESLPETSTGRSFFTLWRGTHSGFVLLWYPLLLSFIFGGVYISIFSRCCTSRDTVHDAYLCTYDNRKTPGIRIHVDVTKIQRHYEGLSLMCLRITQRRPTLNYFLVYSTKYVWDVYKGWFIYFLSREVRWKALVWSESIILPFAAGGPFVSVFGQRKIFRWIAMQGAVCTDGSW